jgi:hypothetical protein
MNNNSSLSFTQGTTLGLPQEGLGFRGRDRKKEGVRSLERSPRQFSSLQTKLETSRDASARSSFFFGQSVVVARAP